jgi:predicted permease
VKTRRAYRTLLKLLPARLREKHRADMEELFLDRLAAARARSRAAACAAWLHAALDILTVAAREPLRTWRRRALVGPPTPRRPLMLGSDLRYAFRAMARQKSAAALVVLMLALGIAANVAVFSLVNGLFLRPFPFPEPERLVYVNETAPRWNLDVVGVNYPDFHAWRVGAKLFEGIALYDTVSLNVSDARGAERLTGASVTHDFDDVLRLRPVVGRFFTPEEDRPKGPPVVVLAYGLWMERFGGRPDAVGQTIRLDGVPRTIIGVLPPEGAFPDEVRFWVPLAGDPNQEGQSYGFAAIGRLKPRVSLDDAGRDLMRAHQPIFETRDKEKIVTPFVRDLRAEFVRDFSTAASTLFVAVLLLLAVACANVASVMLAHAIARRREMGIRLAVGATRMRLLRQLLVENLLLAIAGGIAGVVLGQAAVRLLVASLPDTLPRWAGVGLDARVLGFAIVASTATVFLFGWAPALHAVRGDLRGAMNNAANAQTGSPAGRLTLRGLVGAEFALAAVLIICSGLLARAYDRVRQVDPGFRADGVLAFRVALPEATYKDNAARLAFWDRLLERMRAVPGVESAGLITCPPLSCHWGTFFEAEGQTRGPNDPNPVVLYRFASDSYLQTVGLRMKQGRFLEPRDGRNGAPPVIVINERFAETFFPGVADPIGRRVRSGGREGPWRTVVGVVRDIKHYGLDRPMRPGVYRPLPENPNANLAVVLHADGNPDTLVAPVRAALAEVDSELPMYAVRSMHEEVQRSLAIRSTVAWMLAVFAGLGLVLALSGTYGVTSYLVSQRTRELGIRVALGAGRSAIVRTVLRGSLVVAAAGVVIGVGASVGLMRLLSELLFGVNPNDVLILTAAGGVLFGSAAIANWWPARRAARVDPVLLLRQD